MARALVRIDGGVVRLVECLDRDFCRALESSGYLASGALEGLEAAYQCVAGGVEDEGGDGWGCALRIVSSLGIWLPLLIVYMDLRRRGRKPRPGARDNTLWVSFGSRRVEFLVVEEGGSLSFERLGLWSRLAAGDGFTPVIAIVDRVGGITYYEARVVEGLS